MGMKEQDLEQKVSCDMVVDIVTKTKDRVALYFKSEGCGMCDKVDDVLEKIEPDIKTPIIRIERKELEDSNCKKLAQQSEISHFPTIVVFQKGKPQDTIFFDKTNPKDIEQKIKGIDG